MWRNRILGSSAVRKQRLFTWRRRTSRRMKNKVTRMRIPWRRSSKVGIYFTIFVIIHKYIFKILNCHKSLYPMWMSLLNIYLFQEFNFISVTPRSWYFSLFRWRHSWCSRHPRRQEEARGCPSCGGRRWPQRLHSDQEDGGRVRGPGAARPQAGAGGGRGGRRGRGQGELQLSHNLKT